MNKVLFRLFIAVALISFSQDSLSANFHRQASVVIVKKAAGIEPVKSGGGRLVVSGENHFQIAYLEESSHNKGMFKNNKQNVFYNRFVVYYE